MKQICFWGLFILLCLSCRKSPPEGAQRPNLFFTYHFSLDDKTPTEQVNFLQKIGFEGITYQIQDARDALSAAYAAAPEVQSGRFRIVAPYYYLYFQQGITHYRAELAELLPRLQAIKADLWVVVSGTGGDDVAWAAMLTEIAALGAERGVKIVIYPHDSDYVESAEHAMRLIERSGHPNLYLSFHLCHEMRAGNAGRMEAVIRRIAPRLQLASLSGTFTRVNDNAPTWEDAILPLDEGDYDVRSVYRLLRRYGYKGPIGLHTYGITAPDHWQRSMAVWQSWQ